MTRSQARHRPRPSAARPEYRQGGAGDAQFRADRDAAGRAARRLAQPRRGPGRERRRRRCSSRRRCSTRVAGGDRRLPTGLRLDRPPPRPGHAGARARADGATEIAASAGRSAILFGPERSGLETEEVALANAIVTVPINPEFGSLNLAQAVILLAYEWSRRERPRAADRQGARAARAARRARRADRPARRGARRQGLFPPAVAHSGDEEHDPHHLHQDRLVVARGEGRARDHPRAGQPASPPELNPLFN